MTVQSPAHFKRQIATGDRALNGHGVTTVHGIITECKWRDFRGNYCNKLKVKSSKSLESCSLTNLLNYYSYTLPSLTISNLE